MKTSLIIAMSGTLLFSIAIYIILSIYNKFFVASHLKDAKLYKESLNSPSDTEEAIRSFIIKNRIK